MFLDFQFISNIFIYSIDNQHLIDHFQAGFSTKGEVTVYTLLCIPDLVFEPDYITSM